MYDIHGRASKEIICHLGKEREEEEPIKNKIRMNTRKNIIRGNLMK
jgi:hypothetical protein